MSGPEHVINHLPRRLPVQPATGTICFKMYFNSPSPSLCHVHRSDKISLRITLLFFKLTRLRDRTHGLARAAANGHVDSSRILSSGFESPTAIKFLLERGPALPDGLL